jgi:hypothetical protein
MNTYPDQRHRYGDWRDMSVEDLRGWLHLQVTSWWRHATLMDLYDDHQTNGALLPQRSKTTAGA